MLFGRRKKRKRRARVNTHYHAYKEFARGIIHTRLAEWNRHYGFTYKRIAIRNQRRCWGSCSEHKNLNFNYKIIFLPETLMDYVIVHELCHIEELNHSPQFWALVARTLPDYTERRAHLRRITSVPVRGFPSSIIAKEAATTVYN